MYLFNKLVIWFLPLVPKFLVRLISKPYVAGAKLQDAINVVKKLNEYGMCATMDVLGESAKQLSESEEAVQEYFNVLDAIVREKLDCNISLKLTQLGLLIDYDQCYQNIRIIAQKANSLNIFMRIDMEDSSVTTDTIEIFSKIHKEFKLTGIAIQTYLRRSQDDVKKLIHIKTNFRLCKGIYIEHRKIAYKNPEIIVDNFALLMRTAFKNGSYVGIATHDEKVVWHALNIIEELQLEKNQYEFQMLLGVDEELRSVIVNAGHKLRVYVPYGKSWYAYCRRRLKENPKIALYVLKAMFGNK